MFLTQLFLLKIELDNLPYANMYVRFDHFADWASKILPI